MNNEQALSNMMEMDKMDIKWGNLYGYVLLPLFIGMRDDPLDYVQLQIGRNFLLNLSLLDH